MAEKDEIHRLMQEAINRHKGPVTKDILDSIAAEVMNRINNRPLPETEGLSPIQLQGLLYHLFGPQSLVKVSRNVKLGQDVQSPFLSFCLHYLDILQRENEVKLTKTGAMPVKHVRELTDLKIVEDIWHHILIPVRTEKDSSPILMTRWLCKDLELTKIRNGKLSLTHKGTQLKDSPSELLAELTIALFTRISWGSMDGYESKMAGQHGAGFTLVLLKRYGKEERSANFYAEKFMKAFPVVLDEFNPRFGRSREEVFTDCYTFRTFEQSLNWLGIVETRETGSFREMNIQKWVKTTPLFEDLFVWDDIFFDGYS
jgi:hypothetical protein